MLEKENKTRKEHEEFYIDKAREWKNRALKYERTLEKHNIDVPSRENKATVATKTVDPSKCESSETPVAPLQEQKDVSNLEKLKNYNSAADQTEASVTPTENWQLVLNR